MIGAVAVLLSIFVDWLLSLRISWAGAVAEFMPVCKTWVLNWFVL